MLVHDEQPASVSDERVKEFCRYYSTDAKVRNMLAYEDGADVSLRRIARVRKALNSQRIPFNYGAAQTGNGSDKPGKFQWKIREASRLLGEAIEREHPGFYNSGFAAGEKALG